MKRFDCPGCGGSLRFRLLQHVPQSSGQIAFSCIHCQAILTYNESPLDAALWGTRWRRMLTLIGGMVLFSGIAVVAGRWVSLSAVGAVGLGLAAAHFLSPRPAYKVLKPPIEG